MMRTGARSWVHGTFQLFSLVLLIVGFGLGIRVAQTLFYSPYTSIKRSLIIKERQFGPFGSFGPGEPFTTTTTTAVGSRFIGSSPVSSPGSGSSGFSGSGSSGSGSTGSGSSGSGSSSGGSLAGSGSNFIYHSVDPPFPNPIA